MSASVLIIAAKRVATLQARAALSGIALHHVEGENGRPVYIATKWALTKQFESLDEVEAWIDRVTDKPGST